MSKEKNVKEIVESLNAVTKQINKALIFGFASILIIVLISIFDEEIKEKEEQKKVKT